jgi:hypothetical protein
MVSLLPGQFNIGVKSIVVTESFPIPKIQTRGERINADSAFASQRYFPDYPHEIGRDFLFYTGKSRGVRTPYHGSTNRKRLQPGLRIFCILQQRMPM